ncbi:hypothetical protein [Pedobacter cryoconitis]|nr:hypothetical protein [Pedobacter cryoconitis]
MSHSHLVRRHVANLVGLGKLIQAADEIDDMQDAVKMIVQSSMDLDLVIRELYK